MQCLESYSEKTKHRGSNLVFTEGILTFIFSEYMINLQIIRTRLWLYMCEDLQTLIITKQCNNDNNIYIQV